MDASGASLLKNRDYFDEVIEWFGERERGEEGGQTESQFENRRENMLFHRGRRKILTLAPIDGKISQTMILRDVSKGWELGEIEIIF